LEGWLSSSFKFTGGVLTKCKDQSIFGVLNYDNNLALAKVISL